MMKIGIEHEFVFKDSKDIYLDFETADYALFQNIVDEFPYVEGDENFFDCKSLETKPKRCYVEGFERFDLNGKLTETIPKGIEIRTIPHGTVDQTIEEFVNIYSQVMKIASTHDLYPLLTASHPFKTSMILKQPLNSKELNLRTTEQLTIASNAMLFHGLHINLSIDNLQKEKLLEYVNKMNYYLPFLLPFSFSSPFYNNSLFEGFSYRIFSRARTRKLVRVQKRKEVDVIEFAGFDACGDSRLLKSLILLLKGMLLDKTLTKRAATQDAELVKLSALKGFEDESIKKGGLMVLEAAKAALEKDEAEALEFLETMLSTNNSYAKRMKETYLKTGDIIGSASDRYDFV